MNTPQSDYPMDRASEDNYYMGQFAASVRTLVTLVGRDKFNTWFDKQFPGDADLSRVYTWKEKWEAAEKVYSRIMSAGNNGHRGAAIARELGIEVDPDGEQ